MRATAWLCAGVIALGLVAIQAATVGQGAAQGGAGVPLDADDIGGVVSGPKGPEAGVWVIAETTDLPTRFVRIVVTDDAGRYLIPDLPSATYSVWVRGYGLVDSAEGADRARQAGQPHGGRRARRPGRGAVLPGRLLAVVDQGAGQERVPGNRTVRQRHRAEHEEPGRVAAAAQVRRLHGVPCRSAPRQRARCRPPFTRCRPSTPGSGASPRARPAPT